jgi:hypothetical protein
MAVWALGRLASAEMVREAEAVFRPGEVDAVVVGEWEVAHRPL